MTSRAIQESIENLADAVAMAVATDGAVDFSRGSSVDTALTKFIDVLDSHARGWMVKRRGHDNKEVWVIDPRPFGGKILARVWPDGHVEFQHARSLTLAEWAKALTAASDLFAEIGAEQSP